MLFLQEIQDFIQKLAYRQNPPELYEPIRYLMDLGGKRLRPILVLLGYELYKSDYQRILSPAVAVEVFHNFTLMHDDIMDNAPLRRNMLTVHEKWNTNIAILSGDVMLVRAYQLFLAVESQYLKEVLEKFNICASEVCEGQQLDMNFETKNQVSEQEYIEMIRLKTAVLLGFSLELGGILGGASKEDLVLLKSFGENIGIAFQLKDDLLDVYGESEKFGKQVGGDIIANKKTFLLIEALQLAQKHTDKALSKKLDFWLSNKDFDKQEKVKNVIEIYNELHIKSLTEQKIQYYYQLAFSQLEALHTQNKQNLVDFVTQLWHREK